jgi:hypothetical protein
MGSKKSYTVLGGTENMANYATGLSLTDGDYTLTDGAAWLTVKKFSIRINATDEGVVVDIYPLGDECSESLASCYAFDSEAEQP